MSAASQINSPRDAIALLWRHKTIIVLWPLACLVLAALFYVFCPRKYESEARLFVRIGRESVGIDPAATTGQTMPLYTADRKDEVRSTQEVFKSRAVAAAVVDSLGPDVVLGHGSEAEGSLVTFVTKPIGWVTDWIAGLDPISERESAIITVERSLNVGGEQQATTIVLKYVANSPQLAQDVCRTIVAVGQQEYMRVHRSAQSKPFFTEQQNRLRDQLDESLEALRRAKNEMGFSSIEQRRTTLEAQYSAVELDRLSTDQQLATSQAHIEDLQKQIADIPEREVAAKKSLPNQGADMLRDRLYDLQVKSMDLGARYNGSHPLLLAVNEQLSEAQKVLAEQSDHRVETSDEINPVHRRAVADDEAGDERCGRIKGPSWRVGETKGVSSRRPAHRESARSDNRPVDERGRFSARQVHAIRSHDGRSAYRRRAAEREHQQFERSPGCYPGGEAC